MTGDQSLKNELQVEKDEKEIQGDYSSRAATLPVLTPIQNLGKHKRAAEEHADTLRFSSSTSNPPPTHHFFPQSDRISVTVLVALGEPRLKPPGCFSINIICCGGQRREATMPHRSSRNVSKWPCGVEHERFKRVKRVRERALVFLTSHGPRGRYRGLAHLLQATDEASHTSGD